MLPQDDVPKLITRFRGLPKPDILQNILNVSRPEQRSILNLDVERLPAIVNVTDNFGSMAKVYHPQGRAGKADVLYCTPLHSVERDRTTWIRDHLSKRQDFSESEFEDHECEGDHADMLNPTYVEGFEKILSSVLQAWGI